MDRASGIAGVAHHVLAACVDVLWPPRCGGCDRLGPALCESCASALPLIDRADACPRCGAPDGLHGCAECGRISLSFTAARCAGVHDWPLSRLVTMHKDAGELRLTQVLAGLMLDAADEWCEWAQAIVPIPASPAAIARRGFDHGALLAAEFARLSGVPAVDALRSLPRRDQRKLSQEGRIANARSSMAVHRGVGIPQRIVVVDDVMTTCATMDAAAVALLGAGAREVRALCVSRACGGRM